MACKPICSVCPRFVISQAVTYANGVLTVNIPAGSYENGEKYCLVIAQAIPDATIINAPRRHYHRDRHGYLSADEA